MFLSSTENGVTIVRAGTFGLVADADVPSPACDLGAGQCTVPCPRDQDQPWRDLHAIERRSENPVSATPSPYESERPVTAPECQRNMLLCREVASACVPRAGAGSAARAGRVSEPANGKKNRNRT